MSFWQVWSRAIAKEMLSRSSAWVTALVLACYLPVLRAESTTTPAPSTQTRSSASTPTTECSKLCQRDGGSFSWKETLNTASGKNQADGMLVVNCHYLSSPFPSLSEINRVVLMLCRVILVSMPGPVPTMLVCRGCLLHTDPQERAKTTTASSDCRPRPKAPDNVSDTLIFGHTVSRKGQILSC